MNQKLGMEYAARIPLFWRIFCDDERETHKNKK